MVGVVAHQGREIKRHRESGLPVLEQELVALVGVAGAAEAGELAHRPQSPAITGWMNAPRIRIESRHSQCFGAGLSSVERGVNRAKLFLGIAEGDVAQLTLLVFL